MRKTQVYETNNSFITVRPNFTNDTEIAYVTIASKTDKVVNVQKDQINDLIVMLQAVLIDEILLTKKARAEFLSEYLDNVIWMMFDTINESFRYTMKDKEWEKFGKALVKIGEVSETVKKRVKKEDVKKEK